VSAKAKAKAKGGRRGRERLSLPFLSHQVLEYLAALYVLQVGATVGGRAAAPCYVIGVLILAAATFSGRPLGGGRLPRQAHRVVDIVLVLAIAVAPFAFGFAESKSALVRLEALAVALAALVWVTNYGYPERVGAGQIARGLGRQGSRAAGRMVGRRLSRRRPPGRT
jgi:hypothetical protein